MASVAELEQNNLLKTPGRALVPGEDFQLVFQRTLTGTLVNTVASLTAADVEGALEDSPDFYPIPNTGTVDGAVYAVTVKVQHQPANRTIGEAFVPIKSKGAWVRGVDWLQDQVELRYVVPSAFGRPAEVSHTLVGAGKVETNPVGHLVNTVTAGAVGTFKGLAILLLLVAVVLVLLRFGKRLAGATG